MRPTVIVQDMRELFPTPRDDVDPAAAYRSDSRETPTGRPWVLLNMITSVDGATTAGERSGSLGGPADRAVFMILRSLPDVILVGAGTMRKENYGPPKLSDEAKRWRLANGLAELPRLAIVSGRLNLGTDEKAFSDPDRRSLIITKASADDDRRDDLSTVADLIVSGTDDVDLTDGLDRLAELGTRVVLCEGGPTLNGALFDRDLVDEICWTIAPTAVGGDSRRLIAGATSESMVGMRLARVLEQDGYLFIRYVRA